MMRDLMRFFTTLFIWGMVGGILLAMFVSSTSAVSDGNVVPVTLFLSIAAAVSTLAVWASGRGEGQTSVQQRKSKRYQPRRAERLIEELDDDEIYDLEMLLLARDEANRHHLSER